MNKEKIYILQIDLPDGSVKGDEYKLRGDLYCNQRFNDSKNPVSEGRRWFTYQVENNEKFFKLKAEEKTFIFHSEDHEYHYLFHICFGNPFTSSSSKIISIKKKRLSEILIAESKGELFIDNEEDRKQRRLRTEKEHLQFGEECFNAARKNNTDWYFKYKNFSDYMNSIKK